MWRRLMCLIGRHRWQVDGHMPGGVPRCVDCGLWEDM